MSEKYLPHRLAVTVLEDAGLCAGDDRVLSGDNEGVGVAFSYRTDGRDLSIATASHDGQEKKTIYLSGAGLNLLIAALVDMALVDRKREVVP